LLDTLNAQKLKPPHKHDAANNAGLYMV